MPKSRFITTITGAIVLYCIPAYAQWSPIGGLLNVPVTRDCSETAGNIASAKTDSLFLCPARAEIVDSQVNDASHFYIVHEYGLLAIRTTSDRLADCWAAHQLAGAPNGRHYVKQWITHWTSYGVTRPNFGTPAQRIANVRACCACGI
ncbi:hypothetical protein MKK67_08350 [Methylobacterium sp. J-072]|uniref:hypothetical protein n=1 Tax=Methylobacterium sp. J-072 TaxID=2836651 RepID=UPI001FBB5F54|nr:hypothetical protein [Methylobacterium sp. J-072]MCJ2092508.1 hypothetical protein [Methylobacterium sp. J-072]